MTSANFETMISIEDRLIGELSAIKNALYIVKNYESRNEILERLEEKERSAWNALAYLHEKKRGEV